MVLPDVNVLVYAHAKTRRITPDAANGSRRSSTATRRTALIALQSLPDTGMMRIVPVKQCEQGTAIDDDVASHLQGRHNSRDGARIDRFVGS